MSSYAPSADSTATSVDVSTTSAFLLTNMHELTVLQGALASGAASRRSASKLFGRKLPGSCRFDVMAGASRLLDTIEAFIFTPVQIDFLHRTGVVNDETLGFLHDYRFSGTVRGYAEGECYFTGSPLLTVGGTFIEACILETLTLSICDYNYTVAITAPRMTIIAHGRPCADFGICQAHEQVAVAAARASVIGGLVGTSNLEAGLLYGIPAMGASARSFTLPHNAKEEAFAVRVVDLRPSTMILVDTYNIATSMERVVKATRATGGELGAVRLDSGDLVAEAFRVCAQLDTLEATSMRVTVTNDPDKHTITALGVAPVDSYGVDTKFVTDSGRPAAALVYKLVGREGADGTTEEVAKLSSGDKPTVGGHKWTGRILNSKGVAAEKLVAASSSQDEGASALGQAGTRLSQVFLVDEGRIIEERRGKEILGAAAERYQASHAEFPYDAWHLNDGESVLPTRHAGLDGRGTTRC